MFYFLCAQSNSICGFSGRIEQSQRRFLAPCVVVSAAASSHGRPEERNVTVSAQSSLKEMRDAAAPVIGESTVSGGIEDVYGEDSATEDQAVTPWSVSVARYCIKIIHVFIFLFLFLM